jgi:DNA modification methylase
VAEVALSLGRHYIGCELNPEYAAMFAEHRSQQIGLPYD